jgi:uncharacterized protein Veg
MAGGKNKILALDKRLGLDEKLEGGRKRENARQGGLGKS